MNGDFNYEEILMVKTAWYYYIENYTQQRISELLGISRIRVIRLLEKARQNGIVSFRIRQDNNRRMRVEKELITRFSLNDAFVIPVSGDVSELNESLAQAAAMYIGDRLTDNTFINMGYGDTPSRILNHLARSAEHPINAVSLTGGVSYYLPNTQSSVFNARLHLIPSPLILGSPEQVQVMFQEESVQRIRQMSRAAKMTVVGIGSMSSNATIIQNGILTKADFLLLEMQGAVGDILSHFIDKDGNPVQSSLEQRLLSTPLEELRKLKNVIGVAAVSTTCMREGILLYDRDGREIWACANVDARSTDEVGRLIQRDPALELQLYAQSGQSYALNAIPRILWVKDKMPEIYEKTAAVGMFNDWLIYRLTGVLAVESSNGSTTGLMDLQSRRWDPSIARRCGLREDIFPPVMECGSVAGAVSARGAAQTGLAEGTPVVVGGGDCQLGTIGVGACDPGQATVFGGSFWQYEFNTDSGKTDPQGRVRVNCHAVPGVWQYEALAFKPGLVMRWFRDGFCQLEKQQGAAQGADPYDLMNREAEKIPAGCHGMMCCFSDVMNFINWKHASPTFTNFELDPEKFNRYTFYRAILENTALIVKGHIDLVKEATGNEPEELIFAGGASKSPLWCQILADATGKNVRTPVVKEATALGAAILAGYGVKLYPSIAEGARRTVRFDHTYVPNMENHAVYQNMYQVWRQVYAAQLALCDRGLTKNMWIAPGL